MIEILLTFLLVIAAQDGQADRAKAHYLAGDYEQALALYQSELKQEGADQGSLHYNMGNCAYRLERYADAVYHFRCAELYLPRNADLRSNLHLARNQLGIQPPAALNFTGLILTCVDWFTAGELLILISILESIGLIGFVLLRGNPAGRIAMLAIVLLALLLAARLIKTEYDSGPAAGMVLASQVALRAEPHRSVPVLFELRAGEAVQIAEQSERWARVVHARGDGWTEVGGIGLIR